MLINLDHVYAGYNDSLVLEDVNLTVNYHDFIGVIGP
ncbi:MAG TPA: zinc ABC transporter ATP-binding protein, partial [Bacteroidales bacterium]|nr:zinc ABC transporter ATP-binding protein [Bacteroidales bacterium]